MNKFAQKVLRFMENRNGVDQLNIFLLVVYIVLFFVNLFVKSSVILWIEIIIIFYGLFRFYSRNKRKRQIENAWFLKLFYKTKRIKNIFNKIKPKVRKIKKVKIKKGKHHRIKKNKTDKFHTFVICPVCNSELRVRKIKGERYVLCSKCHNEVKINIK